MAKGHVKNRIDPDVLKKADEIAEEMSKIIGVEISQGQAIERAVRDLHFQMFGNEEPKQLKSKS